MMQNHTGHVSMDSEFQGLRINMQDKICKCLEGIDNTNLSSEWKQRLPDIAKRIEEAIFTESLNKDDYMSKFRGGIQYRMINKMMQNEQRQQAMAHHYVQSNSSVSGLMIPTPPGISHNPTGTMRMPSLMESNQGINPTTGPPGIPMSNGYQLSHRNMSINQTGSTSMSASIGMQHQVMPQMIRTPVFNSTSTTQATQLTVPMNNGSGMQSQKQQQYNTLSGQVRPGMQSVPMNQKHSFQGFGDGMMNNNSRLGLLGSNMQQLMNGQGMSKWYMDIGGTYGNLTKPLQQGFSSQQIQQRMPSSLSQPGASLMGNNTVTKQVDMTMSSSGNCYNPAGPSNMSSASNLNKISTVGEFLQLKPRPMMTRGGNQLHQQIMQQKQQQQQQPMMTRGGNQLHQQSMQQKQPMMTRGGNNTFSRQSSLSLIGSLGGINTNQVMAESALLTNNHLMLPQLADFQVPFGNNEGGQGQFFDPLAGSNALNQTVQSDESSYQNGVATGRLRGGVHQPDSILVQQQSQWRPTQQMQQKNHQMIADSDNNSHNSNAWIEKNQISQNKLDQPCMTILSEGVQAPGPSFTTMLVPKKGSSQSMPSHRETNYQLKLILFLFYARFCPALAGHCSEKNCVKAQQIYKHIKRCRNKQCQVHFYLGFRCLEAQTVLLHFHNCQEENCPVCILAHKFINKAKHKSLTLKSGCCCM